MSDSRIPNPKRLAGPSGRRPVRKRAPVFPAPMLDRALLELLAQADVPLSAYDLAAGLAAQGRGLAAMSIYRALDRLCSSEAIEKVETLSAYRLKDIPQAILTICLSCGRTRSLPAPQLHDAVERVIVETGFSPRGITIEATGLCPECRP